jgi:hypothetical protein
VGADLTSEEVEEIYFVRALLEKTVARLVLNNIQKLGYSRARENPEGIRRTHAEKVRSEIRKRFRISPDHLPGLPQLVSSRDDPFASYQGSHCPL